MSDKYYQAHLSLQSANQGIKTTHLLMKVVLHGQLIVSVQEKLQVRASASETELTMCADTGASTTIIDETHYLSLVPRPELRKSKAPVFGFSSKIPLEILGEFEATLVLGDRSVVSLVSAVKGCCEDCIRLEVVSLNESKLVRNSTRRLSIQLRIPSIVK